MVVPPRKTRLQVTRENFRRSNSADSDNASTSSKPLMRRLSLDNKYHHRGRHFSPVDLAETTFTMTTIEEENEVNLSLRNLALDAEAADQ